MDLFEIANRCFIIPSLFYKKKKERFFEVEHCRPTDTDDPFKLYIVTIQNTTAVTLPAENTQLVLAKKSCVDYP